MATLSQSTASEAIRAGATRGLVWIAAAAVFATVGALGGFALAVGELDALWVSLSVVAAIAVLVDYRIGAVLLIIMLPVSDSNLFPHALMGMTGLNPVNLLIAGTLVSYAVRAGSGTPGRLYQPALVWLYIVPILIGGAIGSFRVDEIVPAFIEDLVVNFHNVPGYLRDMVMKPLFIPIIALLVGVAVARSEKAERYLIPIALSIWVIALIEIVFVAMSGIKLGMLASTSMRGFFMAIGLHANDLGRLFAIAYALLLFTWWESKNPALKVFLFITMGLLAFALLLTFSRGAFVGFLLVNALFLGWKFNAKSLSLAIVALVICLLFMPGYVYNRVLLGIGEGDMDAVSAGRIDGIWLPLLPEVLKSPLWGHGLGSIMWAFPMQIGSMLLVGHPHNAFLEALLDMGVIGLVALCAYYLHVWRGFRALGSNAFLSPEMRGFFQGATAGLLCHLVTGMAGSSLRPESEAAYLWMAIGIMYGLQARRPAG